MIAAAGQEVTRKAISRPKMAFGAIGSILFGLLIGSLVLGFIATRFLGYQVSTIESYSMRPALNRGDLIFTRPVSIGDVKAGDIIVFMEGERTKLLVAHRVYNVMPITTNITNTTTGEVTTSHSVLLRTKGDANADVDAQVVDASTFKGEVLFTIPKVGFIGNGIPLQYLFLAVFVVSTLGWGMYELRQNRRALRKTGDAE